VITLADLRRFAVTRSLFPPTTLQRALRLLGFVQADPIRAPARAQDLILRHRVKDYRAGDLERRYSKLDIEEDYFINYGFVTPFLQALMHPRSAIMPWPAKRDKQAQAVLEFIRRQGIVHPRDVDGHFAHGTTRNYWGGTSNATTQLLDAMHYRGMLRVAGRSAGIRLYAVRESAANFDGSDPAATIDALIDVLVRKYSPLPRASLANLINRLRFCVPQWRGHLKTAVKRTFKRLSHAHVDGMDWYWPAAERLNPGMPEESVQLLAPFDPIVWDRRRFELFWGWPYRFEAYTPAAKRKLGYYALPMLWRDQIIGWGNFSIAGGKLQTNLGYVEPQTERDRSFTRALEAELSRFEVFLGLKS
jgi:uncharacterized protein